MAMAKAPRKLGKGLSFLGKKDLFLATVNFK
jgi:hypothetical protein